MQKIPLDSIQGNEDGPLVSESGAIQAQLIEGAVTELAASFDPVAGVFTLALPGYGTVRASGFLTTSSIGSGPEGQPGARGASGIDGLTPRDGRRGPDGCIGQDGPEGQPGKEGPRGREGQPGETGPEGRVGERGEDGGVKIFYQSEDPGAVGAGAFWVRPRAR